MSGSSSPTTPLLHHFIDASARVCRGHLERLCQTGVRSAIGAGLLASLAVGCADPRYDQLPHDHEVTVTLTHEEGVFAHHGEKVEGELADDLVAPDGTLLAPSGSSVLVEVTIDDYLDEPNAQASLVGVEPGPDRPGSPLSDLYRPLLGAPTISQDWEVAPVEELGGPQVSVSGVGESPIETLKGTRGSLARALGFKESVPDLAAQVPEGDTLELPVGHGLWFQSDERTAAWNAELKERERSYVERSEPNSRERPRRSQ